MRNILAGWVAMVAFGVAVGMGSLGCSRERPVSTDSQQMEAAVKLPGATNVFAALGKKDYEGAMAAWAKVRESVSTEEQRFDFAVFTRELKTRLMEASATDPKAAEALEALRAVTTAR